MTSSISLTRRRLVTWSACAAVAFAAITGPACAATWPDPSTPIHFVVAYPPGGGVDTVARILAPLLAQQLGGIVIVENRPGAGGLIGAEVVAKSPADGYTITLAAPGPFTIWPSLRKLPYDPDRNFTAVSLLVTMPHLLITGASTPYKDIASLIAAAKAPDAQLVFASGGMGSLEQIAGEQLNAMAGLHMMHVAYKGTTPALTDIIAGRVPIMFSDPSAKSLIDSGKLRALAVTTAKRSRLFPDVPTLAEAGVSGYDAMNWYGLVVPAGTPTTVISQLNAALVSIMARPDVRRRIDVVGMEPTSSTPEQFQQLIAAERVKWSALIRKVGIKAD